MPSGKAHGVDRKYQVTCRDVLIHRDPMLVPWNDDGIDVAFALPDTTWTFDVVLKSPAESMVVAECRRTIAPVKQDDVAAFALKVESLRLALGRPVSGFFFTKTRHQLGAIRVGQYYGIQIAVVAQHVTPPVFNLDLLTYDAERHTRIRHLVMHLPTTALSLEGYQPTVSIAPVTSK